MSRCTRSTVNTGDCLPSNVASRLSTAESNPGSEPFTLRRAAFRHAGSLSTPSTSIPFSSRGVAILSPPVRPVYTVPRCGFVGGTPSASAVRRSRAEGTGALLKGNRVECRARRTFEAQPA